MEQSSEETVQTGDTARACVKDFVRPFVRTDWSLNQLIDGLNSVTRPEYGVQFGKGGPITDQSYQSRIIERGQVVVTSVGGRSCWIALDLAEVVAEITEEMSEYPEKLLVDVFAEEREEPQHVEMPTKGAKKRAPTYRSYMAGDCANCGQWLGLVEIEGGRDRHYCNATCRVQHHRKQQREKNRAATLQYNSELREYWQEYGVRGEVLLRLQEILLTHGKAAARAATDAVLVALAAQEQVGSQEQFQLIDEILLGGEEINFEEVCLDEFRIPEGVQGWNEFVSNTPISMLRQMKGYIIERKQHEHYKVQGRKRLEALSHDVSHENE